ncbi:hypothetical protein D3C72_1930210 [compost metagenome]
MILLAVEEHDATPVRRLKAAAQIVLLDAAQGHTDCIFFVAVLFVGEVAHACGQSQDILRFFINKLLHCVHLQSL